MKLTVRLERVYSGGRVGAILGLCALLAQGCSNLDFGRGPLDRIADALDSGKPFVAADENVARVQAEKLTKALEAWEKQREPDRADYLVGRGDTLAIDIPALEGPGRVTRLDRVVRADGAVTLPLVGDIVVAGNSVFNLQNRIAQAYEGRFLKNPQIVVRVQEYHSVGVLVSGAVQRPQVHFLRENETTLLGVLSMAGGLSSYAGNDVYLMRPKTNAATATATGDVFAAFGALTNGVALAADGTGSPQGATHPPSETAWLRPDTNQYDCVVVDVSRLLEMGDPRLNLVVKGGDIVNVPAAPKTYMYVFGYVGRPGAYELRGEAGMTALRALAMAGGPTRQGRVEKSYILRRTPAGRDRIEVDLAKIANGVRPDVDIMAEDALVVGAGLLMKFMEIFNIGGAATAGVTTGYAAPIGGSATP